MDTLASLFGAGPISTEEKVKQMLIFKAQNQKKLDKKAKSDKFNNKLLADAEWRVEKVQYQGEVDEYVKKVADRMMLTFETWNKEKKKLRESKADEKQTNAKKEEIDKQEKKDVTSILDSFIPRIIAHIECAKKNKPKLAKSITIENQQQMISTNAQHEYKKRVALQMKLAKLLADNLRKLQELQFETNILNKKTAEIPKMVEEKIDMVKGLLDMLLGKLALPMFDPDLPDFDVNAIIALLKSFIVPVIAATKPLGPIIGNIPVLGDFAGILTMMMQSGSTNKKLTPEQLKKLKESVPKLQLDGKLVDKIKAIGFDLVAFCATLPTILCQIAFSMLDLIYSKLQMIMSLLPLGNMFPLNLVPLAITATPKILALIKVLPSLFMDLVKGVLKQKFAEAMMFDISNIKLDFESLEALVDERNARKKALKKLTYSDITDSIYKAKLEKYGYTERQAKTVQTNYKKIFNGTDLMQKDIKKFSDDGQQENLGFGAFAAQNWGTVVDNIKETAGGLVDTVQQTYDTAVDTTVEIATLGYLDGSAIATSGQYNNYVDNNWKTQPKKTEDLENELSIKYGVKEESMTREKPSVEGYLSYFQKLISKSDLSSGLKYDRIKDTKSVVGGFYEPYKEQLTSYGDEVVIEDTMKPLLNQDGTVNYSLMWKSVAK